MEIAQMTIDILTGEREVAALTLTFYNVFNM